MSLNIQQATISYLIFYQTRDLINPLLFITVGWR